MEGILAFDKYRDNGELIAAAATLGYIDTVLPVLDATYGLGTFWKELGEPKLLVRNDLDPGRGTVHHDFTRFPLEWADTFPTVVFDPPYKLNGTDQGEGARYGVGDGSGKGGNVRWYDRIELMRKGFLECARVCRREGHVLFKLQDQVASGQVRWQRFYAWQQSLKCGLELVEMLDMLGGRPQPPGRSQAHARRNSSTLMIFKKTGVAL